MEEPKNCPFCNSNKIGISDKCSSKVVHYAFYCKSCHAYGPRVVYHYDRKAGDEIRKDLHIGFFQAIPNDSKVYYVTNDKNLYSIDEIAEKALKLWNKRN